MTRRISLMGWVLLFFNTILLAQRAPNILFLLADDMSYPYCSVYGDKLIKTPNMAAIAEHGMVFSNAFASTPSCTASRASMLTGKYPHKLGEGVNLVGRLDVSIP